LCSLDRISVFGSIVLTRQVRDDDKWLFSHELVQNVTKHLHDAYQHKGNVFGISLLNLEKFHMNDWTLCIYEMYLEDQVTTPDLDILKLEDTANFRENKIFSAGTNVDHKHF